MKINSMKQMPESSFGIEYSFFLRIVAEARQNDVEAILDFFFCFCESLVMTSCLCVFLSESLIRYDISVLQAK